MLRLLLDEHLSPDIATAVSSAHQHLFITSIQAWRDGAFIGADDSAILTAALEHGLTLVTYDQKTIIPLVSRWGEAGISHAGLVIGHSRTIPTRDIGGVAAALGHLWLAYGHLDWTNRIVYLARR